MKNIMKNPNQVSKNQITCEYHDAFTDQVIFIDVKHVTTAKNI